LLIIEIAHDFIPFVQRTFLTSWILIQFYEEEKSRYLSVKVVQAVDYSLNLFTWPDVSGWLTTAGEPFPGGNPSGALFNTRLLNESASSYRLQLLRGAGK